MNKWSARKNTYLTLLLMQIIFSGVIVAQEKLDQPNIVLIISDDQDYEHLGFMGNTQVKTPHLDQLAKEGTVFTHCHLTASRCRPSLAGLLSGKLPHQNGIYANHHKDNSKGNNDIIDEKVLSPVNSLPNLLKKAGYATEK